jgi:hypothetical protein
MKNRGENMPYPYRSLPSNAVIEGKDKGGLKSDVLLKDKIKDKE